MSQVRARRPRQANTSRAGVNRNSLHVRRPRRLGAMPGHGGREQLARVRLGGRGSAGRPRYRRRAGRSSHRDGRRWRGSRRPPLWADRLVVRQDEAPTGQERFEDVTHDRRHAAGGIQAHAFVGTTMPPRINDKRASRCPSRLGGQGVGEGIATSPCFAGRKIPLTPEARSDTKIRVRGEEWVTSQRGSRFRSRRSAVSPCSTSSRSHQGLSRHGGGVTVFGRRLTTRALRSAIGTAGQGAQRLGCAHDEVIEVFGGRPPRPYVNSRIAKSGEPLDCATVTPRSGPVRRTSKEK